jgi:hypothetical protein
MTARIWRNLAILIAVAGAVDPAVTSSHRVKPDVAVIGAGGPGDAALADRIVRQLSSSFTVVRGPFTGAAAVVAVGDRLPSTAAAFGTPAFAVVPEPAAAHVTIDNLIPPGRLHVHSRGTLTVDVRARHARGRRLSVTLRATFAEATGAKAVALDRVTQEVTSDDESRRVALTFAPATVGVTPLDVVATIDDTPARDTASVAIDVRTDRRAVLVFDGRPSWMSTFVRRALEADPRFVVTSRVVTSREGSVDRGLPPALDLASLALFDAVVIGAPDALGARDVAGLDAFLRDRGGAVVLLLDQPPAGPLQQLAAVGKWNHAEQDGPKVLRFEGSSGSEPPDLSASELAWPAALPIGATALTEAEGRPVIWRTPMGAGRLVVSGALDAWRSRGADTLGFDRFWRSLVADAAAATPSALDVTLTPSMVEPGQRTNVSVSVRGGDARPSEALTATLGKSRVTLRPEARAGSFSATLRAPDTAGTYPIQVTGQGHDATVALVVANGVAPAAAIDRDLLAAWTASRGGQIVPESRLSGLSAAISQALAPPVRDETWHPMRSAWWIVPFTLALGLEWWTRRRAGRR